MRESVRLSWLSTLADCTGSHEAMCSVTKTERHTEEHVEVGAARLRRDFFDRNKIMRFLTVFSPFRYLDNSRLISLLTGLAAGPNDPVNCDTADEIGQRLQEQWDCKLYKDVSLKKAECIKSLMCLTNANLEF